MLLKRTPTEAFEVLYATDFRSLLWTWTFLLKKPRVWFAFLVVILICLVHERSSEMVTPKYLAEGTFSSSTLCRMYLVLKDKYDIITDKQHGFRRKRSCKTQLISTIEVIASKLQTGKDQIYITLLDFAKAFDKVPRVRLLHTLNYYCIHCGTLIERPANKLGVSDRALIFTVKIRLVYSKSGVTAYAQFTRATN